MSEDANKHDYPPAPLEENISTTQQQPLITPKTGSLPPQPPTYDQAIGGSTTTATPAATVGPSIVVVTEPVSSPYGPQPVDIQCPYCHNYARTCIRYKPTSRTHLVALLLCLFQLYCCICLPYCIGSCMNTAHYCGMCNRYLGTYIR